MAYTIDRYNNTQLTVVEDGTIDQTTDLKFIGKNYAGYGEIQNENFLYLLENFSGGNPPPRAISGQIWFDSTTRKLKFYDGTKFRTTGGAEVSEAQPAGLTEGDFWWDTANEQLYAYNGSGFVLVGPQGAGDNITQMRSGTIRSTDNETKVIISAVVDDRTIAIISKDDFNIDNTDPENAISGFDRIKPGINLINTPASGVTDGGLTPTHSFNGTATNALKLGGVSASEFVQAGQATFATLAEFADIGLAVGDSNDLRLKIENDSEAIIENAVGTILKVNVKNTSGTVKNTVNFFADKVEPGETTTDGIYENITIGTASAPFSQMHADNFFGLASKATAITNANVTNGAATSSLTATPETVAIRDSNGDIFARLFQGTATTAQYADLAEKYTTDYPYPVGTVMKVAPEGNTAETMQCTEMDIPIGVISAEPAYLMNADIDGQAIGLKGRVPVRVVGPVYKGEAVYTRNDGTAFATDLEWNHIVGIALETDESPEEKLIECVLKV